MTAYPRKLSCGGIGCDKIRSILRGAIVDVEANMREMYHRFVHGPGVCVSVSM